MTRREALHALLEAGEPEVEQLISWCSANGISICGDASVVEGALRTRTLDEDANAKLLLAYLIVSGLGATDDLAEARRLAESAAEAGLASAEALLSRFDFEGLAGTAKNQKRGIERLNAAAKRGYTFGYVLLGVAEYEGLVAGGDSSNGIKLLRVGAELGEPLAAFHLGNILLRSGDSESSREGLEMLHFAAERGVSSANRVLASIYELGAPGVQVSHDRSRECLARARHSEKQLEDRINAMR